MEKALEIVPYLPFGGDCEAAVGAYIEAFGGEILYLSRWPEGNREAPQLAGKVMHTEFVLGRTRLAAGDAAGTGGNGTAMKLMIHMDSQEEALRAVAVLAEGGEVLSPLKPHPAPDDGGCGSLTRDRFGLTWIITCPNPQKQSGGQMK